MGLSDTAGVLKVVPFPLGRNEILIRVENMQDLFDGEGDVIDFSISEYCMALMRQANQGIDVDVSKLTIEERSLSNNQPYDEVVAKKFAWPTTESVSPVVYPEDSSNVVKLQPQRIR